MEFFSQFAGFFQNGGPFMFVILLTGVAVLGLSFERIWVIGRAALVNSGKLTRDLLRMVGQGDHGKAIALARKVRGPVGEVAVAILDRRTTATEEKLQNAADGAATIVLPPLAAATVRVPPSPAVAVSRATRTVAGVNIAAVLHCSRWCAAMRREFSSATTTSSRKSPVCAANS